MTPTAKSPRRPSPVREQSKADRRQRILGAAARLFEQQGFHKTTMEAVAERSGVGVATVYNYFRTKEGIVYELITPDLERVWALNEEIIAAPPGDPAEAVLAIVRNFESAFNRWRFRKLLRALSIPTQTGARGVLEKIVDWSDRQAEQQFRDVLRALQLRGRIHKDANIKRMATIVFATFNHEYMLYITHERIPAKRIFSDLEQLIRTLFQRWRP